MARGRPKYNEERRTKYILDYGNVIYHFDESINPNGAYMVENKPDPKLKELELAFQKLEDLKEPQYHPNGRKKRITKDLREKIRLAEEISRKEYYRIFPTGKYPKY